MFFFLSKTLDLAATPLAWAILLVVAGAIAAWRGRRRIAVGAPVLALAVLGVFASGAVANRLTRALEVPPLPDPPPDATYDAVILLGGMVDASATESNGAPAYNDSVERLLATYDVLRAGRAANVLVSGGPGSPVVPRAEARVLADQLEAWGIARDRITTEERSRNTRENALDAVALIRARGWRRLLLVTSAGHMRRAAGCFWAVGLPVDTFTVDFRSHDPERFGSGWVPRADALAASSGVLREELGRIVYRLRGWTVDAPPR